GGSGGSGGEERPLAIPGGRGAALALSPAFPSDFADICEVRGIRRKRRGRASRRTLGSGGVVLSYRGLDQALRETAVSFEPAPALQMEGTATYLLRLPPPGRGPTFITPPRPGPLPRPPPSFFPGLPPVPPRRRPR